jgi:hypothetical protein
MNLDGVLVQLRFQIADCRLNWYSYRVWWIIPGLNRLSELNFGDQAQIGSYQPCSLQSFLTADSHFLALGSYIPCLCERMNK